MTVVIIDYGMGNLGSIANIFQLCGNHKILVSSNPGDLKKADRIILPGVGAFSAGKKNLDSLGFVGALKNSVLIDKVPLLGICLGMQLLADEGAEGGRSEGLGFVAGKVKKLEIKDNSEQIPHVGWNEVTIMGSDHILFNEIPNKSDFYFVHSYHFTPTDFNVVTAITPYCGGFVSSIRHENVFGVQFHPEKSLPWGVLLIKNFLK